MSKEASAQTAGAEQAGDAGEPNGSAGEQGGQEAQGAGQVAAAQDAKKDAKAEGSVEASTTQAGKTEEKPKAAEGDPKDSAPEELKLKLPDGVTMDAAMLGEFQPLAKELGLKSEGAQKLVDLLVKRDGLIQQQRSEQRTEQIKTWNSEIRADKDIGGDKFDANLQAAHRAVVKFGGEALAKRLEETGFGSDPLLVKAWVAVGKSMADDSVAGTNGARGRTPAEARAALEKQMYPSMQPKEQ